MPMTIDQLETCYEWKSFLHRESPMLWRSLERFGYTRENIIESTGLDLFVSRKSDVDYLFIDADDYSLIEELLKENIQINANFFSEISDKGICACDRFLEYCTSFQKCDFSRLSNTELSECFNTYVKYNIRTIAFRHLTVVLDDLIKKLIIEEIASLSNIGIYVDFSDEYIVPPRELSGSILRNDILEIGASIESDIESRVALLNRDLNNISNRTKTLINLYCKKNGWKGIFHYIGAPTSTDDVIEELISYLGKWNWEWKFKETLKLTLEQRKVKLDKLNEAKNKSDNLKYLLSIAQVYKFFRDYRVTGVMQGDYYILGLFKEISNRLGVEEYYHLTVEEIQNGLVENINLNEINYLIEKRKEYFVSYLINGNEYYCFCGGEYHNVAILPHANDNIIKGISVYQGNVSGIVRIVRQISDISAIESSDIVVCSMTNHSMALKLLLCTGIITDEGGLSAHVKQLSEEDHIPCIMGTKIATSVLKTGDVIEMNSELPEGIIRLLKGNVNKTMLNYE